jgi:AraC-like DNA-binding protein
MDKSDLHSAAAARVEPYTDSVYPAGDVIIEGSEKAETGPEADPHPEEGLQDQTDYTAAQKEVADRAHEIIMTNLERHITIAEFARILHASPTQIKVCFQKVYGQPIYSYARSQRMEAASRLLTETDESVLEIAGKFGYENGSKFARAFRTVIGLSPSEYRRRVLWERENQTFGSSSDWSQKSYD